MELGPSLATELVTSADPLSRGLPEPLRPPGAVPGADSAAAPFELLLQMLGNRLPEGLPGGESLPAGGGASGAPDGGPGAGAAPLDPATLAAAPILIAPLVPLPPVLAPAAAAVAGAASGSGLPAPPSTALAEALRVALAGAPTAQAAAPSPVSPAADTTTAAAQAAATGTDAPAAAPVTTPGASSAAPADPRAGLDALFALDPAARAFAPPAAEPPVPRPRTAGDNRVRTLAATPAARAFSAAADLVRADTPAPPAPDAPGPAFDLQTAPSAPAPLATARLDDALSIKLPVPGASSDPTAMGPPTFTSAVSQPGAPSAAAQPAAQLPAHLGAPVDTQSARWHDALASRIHWLVDHAIGEAQIKLNPPELGALDVKISMLDDKTFVQMTAHSSAARDELAQGLPRLRELMSAGGLDLGGATVSGGRDDRSGHAAASHSGARAPAFAAESADFETDLAPRMRLPSSSRIDLFA